MQGGSSASGREMLPLFPIWSAEEVIFHFHSGDSFIGGIRVKWEGFERMIEFFACLFWTERNQPSNHVISVRWLGEVQARRATGHHAFNPLANLIRKCLPAEILRSER